MVIYIAIIIAEYALLFVVIYIAIIIAECSIQNTYMLVYIYIIVFHTEYICAGIHSPKSLGWRRWRSDHIDT